MSCPAQTAISNLPLYLVPSRPHNMPCMSISAVRPYNGQLHVQSSIRSSRASRAAHTPVSSLSLIWSSDGNATCTPTQLSSLTLPAPSGRPTRVPKLVQICLLKKIVVNLMREGRRTAACARSMPTENIVSLIRESVGSPQGRLRHSFYISCQRVYCLILPLRTEVKMSCIRCIACS